MYELYSDCKITKEVLYKDYQLFYFAEFLYYAYSYFIIYSLFHTEISFLLIIAKILFVLNIFVLIYGIFNEFELKNFFQFKFLIFWAFIIILLVIFSILKLKLKYIFLIISFRIIKKIILFYDFILIVFFLVHIYIGHLENKSEIDYVSTRKFFIKFIIFIHAVYEFIVALKINILEKKNWYLIFDYYFLFINLHFIDNFLYLLKTYLTKEEKIKENSISRYFITRFKGVDIIIYLLPIEFKNIHNKMDYLNSISNTFKLENVKNSDELIICINNLRQEFGVQELLYDNNFPDFIINEPFISLSFEECAFRLSESEYIFKYKNRFHINDKMREILLKYNLNRIKFFNRGDAKYIFVFESREEHSIINLQEEYHELLENYSFKNRFY